MLERKITETLVNWKNEKDKPCLLIKGARQVGKTFIIEDFAKKNYKNYIYINFELMKEYKKIFDGNLDFNTLKLNLEVYFPDIPIEQGNTILFLDEIQSCPNARVALKTFALDKTIDVIASGSLLGLYYKEISSYPVGYERQIELYPMDFEEFLWALGIKKNVINSLKDSFFNKLSIQESILSKINEYFKIYLLVGGMPNVVNDYVNNRSLHSVRIKQKEIIESYKNDVLHYADIADKQKILNTFLSIPMQLSKKNKKFKYNMISIEDKNANERKYVSSISWLRDAGIINFCYNLSEPALPLNSNQKIDSFKIYMKDTGLLVSMLDSSIGTSIIDNNLSVNEGAILENICAEEIKTRYENITYFEKKSKLEIDFILNIDGVCVALEVKSGNNKQSKSLKSIINNYKTVNRYIKLENNTNIYVDSDGIEHYPLFMIMFI